MFHRNWKRREFLLTTSAAAAGTALFSLDINASRSPTPAGSEAVEPIVDPLSLEKPNLTVGYVPVNDCAPFAVAWEKGCFVKNMDSMCHSAVKLAGQLRAMALSLAG
jgi:nitrate/nitrite transport system substrate-binding protein